MDTMICTYVSEISEIVVKLKSKKVTVENTKKDADSSWEGEWDITKPRGDEDSWFTQGNSENFWAYLPQSLSDNILVSHKSQALQHHSKRHRVRQRTHKEKGNSEHDRTAQVRLALRRSHTVQNTHTGTRRDK